MSNDDIHEELLRLRKQVAALSAARRKHDAAPEVDEESASASAEQNENEHAIRKQIEDLIKLLQEEVRDMPAMPTLAVFMLGVMVGRFLR